MRALNLEEVVEVDGGLLVGLFAELVKEISSQIIQGMQAPGYNSAAGPGPLGPQSLGNLGSMVTAP
jgi:hypothetical protein